MPVRVALVRQPSFSITRRDLTFCGRVIEIRWHGTAADGTAVERESFDIVRVEDGLAVEHWGCSARVDAAPAPAEQAHVPSDAPAEPATAACKDPTQGELPV